MAKYTCFVISPIGEVGSKTRQDADDLLDLIINPALKEFGFSVMRGDHRAEANQIDVDVIKSVQEADLCVCNLSEPNINVYYELGRRDETGKPVVLLKSSDSDILPIDIATRRYIEFDLDSRHGIRDAVVQLQNFVAPMLEKGFEGSTKAASLTEVAEILHRVERKLDRFTQNAPATAPATTTTTTTTQSNDGLSTTERFRLAIINKDIPTAEAIMDQLQHSMERLRWLDIVVEQVAGIGSRRAGELIIETAEEFIDSSATFSQKVEYLGTLVSYIGKIDLELEKKDLVEQLCERLLLVSEGQDPDDLVQIHNQLNRIYYGIYLLTKDIAWIQKAVDELKKAIQIKPKGFLYSNLALCLEKAENYEEAATYAEICLAEDEKAGKQNADHLETLCRIYYLGKNPKFQDALAQLESLSPGKATLLKRKLNIL